jgi:carboxypeptidase C (cathepsin A)
MKKTVFTLLFFLFLKITFAQETVTHRGTFDGTSMNYSSRTATMIIPGKDTSQQMSIFYISYTKDGVTDPSKRPLTFVFNGGPGSSSVWLHMGGLGPKRILMEEDGGPMAPPYKVVENEYSWMGKTDLVFIDPAQTGFSRPVDGSDKKDFLGYENDIRTVGDFIYRYTSENGRWNSPKFVAGESYGTTRAAGLTGYLQNRHGMYLNGVMLISAVLNFQTIRQAIGNDTPYPLILPTMAATAWYHKQLDPSYSDLESLLEEVERFAATEYLLALQQGDALTTERKSEILKKLSAYTGLSEEYLDQVNMRPFTGRFNKELLRSERKTVGRLDSRFTGVEYDAAGSSFEFGGDPSYSKVIYGPFTTAVNDHLRRTLNYQSELPYEILNGRNVRPWIYAENQYLNVAETLRGAMSNNPYMKVWIANGYYDMATPYFATEYTLDHMFLDPALKPNITMTYYEAGHMMYIHLESLKQFKKDFDAFMDSALDN